MEADLANLRLKDEVEGDPIPRVGNPSIEEEDRRFYLVGRALTDCIIHFSSLKRTLVD